jgi:hypothetical protein
MSNELLDDINSELTFDCDIYSRAASKNTLTGEVSETFLLSIANVKCLIQPAGGKQALKIQGLGIDATHTGFFLWDTAIKEGDKIIYNTRTYWVKYIEKDFCNMEHHYEVLLKIDPITEKMTEV